MKRSLFVALVVMFVLALAGTAMAGTIKDGGITDSAGNPISLGYDQFGYNYQAHMFVGTLDSSDRVLDQTYWGDPNGAGDRLMMKWNDAWLSNKDADGEDGKLDRPADYIGSGAWLTNHQSGDGYTYFCKIVAVPSDAVLSPGSYTDVFGNPMADGLWYTADGDYIGPSIWGSFALTQEQLTGSGAAVKFKGDFPGLGAW